MATLDNERYLRHVWLLGEGGLFVLRRIVKREAANSGQTLEQLLMNNTTSFQNILKEQNQFLFPTPTLVNANVDTWDMSLLLLVLKRMFWQSLSPADRSCVLTLKTYRNDIQGHPMRLSMDASNYFTDRQLLEQSLRYISSGVNAGVEMEDIITRTASGNIDIQSAFENIKDIHEYKISMISSLEERFERVYTGLSDMNDRSKQDMAGIKDTVTHVEEVTDITKGRVQNIENTVTRVEEVTKGHEQKLERTAREILQFKQMFLQKEKHKTTEKLQTIIQAECENEEKQKLATDLLFRLVKVIQVDNTYKDEEIKKIITQRVEWYGELTFQLIDDLIKWFSDMNAIPDAIPCNAQLGSIRIPISCPHVFRLLTFLKYMTSSQCKHRLTIISSTLGKLLGFPCSLSWRIESMDLQNSLSSHLAKMESKKIVLPFHVSSIEGLTKVVSMFEGEERNCHVEKISETLSKIFGDTIRLKTYVEKIQYQEAAIETKIKTPKDVNVVAHPTTKNISTRSNSFRESKEGKIILTEKSMTKRKDVTRSFSFAALKERQLSQIVKEIFRLKQTMFKKEKHTATEDILLIQKEEEANRNVIDKSVILQDIMEESVPETLIELKELSSVNGNRSFFGNEQEEQDESIRPKTSNSIRFYDNGNEIMIGGMDLMPDGGLLVIDINKPKLYKLNSSYKEIGIITLPGNPCDVRYVGEGKTALCIDYRHILIVNVSENISQGDLADVNGVCAGIACKDNLLYIADAQGNVYTFTTDSKPLKNVIYKSKRTSKMQLQRTCIAVSDDGQMIYLKNGKELLTLDHMGNLVSNMPIDIKFRLSDVCVINEAILLCDISLMELMKIDCTGRKVLKRIPIKFPSAARCSPSLMCFDKRRSLLLIAERSGQIHEFKIST